VAGQPAEIDRIAKPSPPPRAAPALIEKGIKKSDRDRVELDSQIGNFGYIRNGAPHFFLEQPHSKSLT
jgi:hypothetical protein